jgi:hypothetical protein
VIAVATPQTLALRLVGTPVSITRCDGWSQRREATPYRDQIAHLLAASGSAFQADHVAARITIAFPDRRTRSAENFAPLIFRGLWEALQDGGWITDRDQTYAEIVLTRGKVAETLIDLEVTPR